jgi:uncharacterized protein (DUF433 family)
MRKKLGKYIVADSSICHGQPTFTGTRIMVHQILGQIARGEDWDTIEKDWGGSVSKAAIAEAVSLASKALLKLEKAANDRVG